MVRADRSVRNEVVRGCYTFHLQLSLLHLIGVLRIEKFEEAIGGHTDQGTLLRVRMPGAKRCRDAVTVLVFLIFTNSRSICDIELAMFSILDDSNLEEDLPVSLGIGVASDIQL